MGFVVELRCLKDAQVRDDLLRQENLGWITRAPASGPYNTVDL